MILGLDTRTRHLRFLLFRQGQVRQERLITVRRPDAILPQLNRFLRLHRTGWRSLRGVVVVLGPGIFSYVRAGVVVANTLAFSRQLPLAGFSARGATDPIPAGDFLRVRARPRPVSLRPVYGQAPRITL